MQAALKRRIERISKEDCRKSVAPVCAVRSVLTMGAQVVARLLVWNAPRRSELGFGAG
jgi:hypothetical protein